MYQETGTLNTRAIILELGFVNFKHNIKKYIHFLKMNYASLCQYLCFLFKETSGFKCGPGGTKLAVTIPWERSVLIPMHVNFLKGDEQQLQEKDAQI